MVLGARVSSKVALLSARKLFARDSSNKLFVGGLSYDTNETILREAFSTHGVVTQGIFMPVKVICDRRSGKSKGFGFVQFSHESEAATALQQMDQQLLEGRNIRVCYANKE
ncbi:glycine-rich RNA-binding protein 4, mitochondrial isoform X1 [Dendrobium catenatum]|uniref:glycine-rich RNA-binding protein 4, mitochondrial isoform X1 n=1 Tax=Dendrobium catenatum TaxID=906689 RepID=UPI00109FBB43|nr:glycine-rich RNA-binding protein 4, mitochondrial isoform X1 [Dendrobium catenatum]